jgi:hypothetical protein
MVAAHDVVYSALAFLDRVAEGIYPIWIQRILRSKQLKQAPRCRGKIAGIDDTTRFLRHDPKKIVVFPDRNLFYQYCSTKSNLRRQRDERGILFLPFGLTMLEGTMLMMVFHVYFSIKIVAFKIQHYRRISAAIFPHRNMQLAAIVDRERPGRIEDRQPVCKQAPALKVGTRAPRHARRPFLHACATQRFFALLAPCSWPVAESTTIRVMRAGYR